jgi:hypothetical protein
MVTRKPLKMIIPTVIRERLRQMPRDEAHSMLRYIRKVSIGWK